MRRTSHLPSTLVLALLVAAPASVRADGPTQGNTQGSTRGSTQGSTQGSINMPLNAYRDLLRGARDKSRPAPAGYALGKAVVKVTTSLSRGAVSADVEASLDIRVYGDHWIMAPVLAAGTAVNRVTVDGEAVQLVTTPAGLAWSTKHSGTYSMRLRYRVDATRNEAGYRLSIPVPQAAATSLVATLPGRDVEAAVIPAAGIKTSADGQNTKVRATIPTTGGIHISWRRESKHRYSISRATYRGRLVGDALALTGELGVDLFAAETVTLPLLPATVTLKEALVDGKPRSLLVEGKHFATLVKGKGAHKIKVSFLVPVRRSEGPPQALLEIPQVPVSRFELTLPGKKEVTVQPTVSVTHKTRGASTVASFNVPLGPKVAVRWSEAAPAAAQAELRANAEVYHVVHADDGVLHARAVVVYKVSRGQTNSVVLELPEAAQVSRVRAANGAVSDWRAERGQRGRPQRVAVFLDRQVQGRLIFEATYELLLGAGARKGGPIQVPLARVQGTHRQRGMVALLATKEFALRPVKERRLTRVGENQLPSHVRQLLKNRVAHTLKYSLPGKAATDPAGPQLAVQTTTPKRKPGKFDARVHTLVSLADVALQGSARVEVNVKSGSILALQLALPEAVNLLSLTAPSLRSHRAKHRGKAQVVDLQFTQEMEGQFKIDVTYERILSESDREVKVPTLAVRGAEVEQGRIAVEALAAVEVQPAATDHLSSLDVTELPRQLVLKTTNPILLAYKYAHVTPPYRLKLRMTRHREVDVQAATIDRGHYQTLYTRDGLAVTRARFTVRNTRRQFLKVELPPYSEVWSAFVNGKSVKPALDRTTVEKNGGPPNVLIKIINSAAGFPVELIYATRTDAIGGLGTLTGQLPRPDTVVTHTRWEVYVPEGLSYRQPVSNMELVEEGTPVTGETIKRISRSSATDGQQAAALRLAVPTHGLRYRFNKLYANGADSAPRFQLAYASSVGATVSEAVQIVGTLVLWLGVFLFVRRAVPRARLGIPRAWLDLRGNMPAVVTVGLGLVMLAITLGYLRRGTAGPIVVTAGLLLGLGAYHALAWRRRQRAAAASALASASASAATSPSASPSASAFGEELPLAAEPDESVETADPAAETAELAEPAAETADPAAELAEPASETAETADPAAELAEPAAESADATTRADDEESPGSG